tara:strand:+ start:169 stop:1047 length:879 start_codon:yes stop_codon:yes gene_type:complete
MKVRYEYKRTLQLERTKGIHPGAPIRVNTAPQLNGEDELYVPESGGCSILVYDVTTGEHLRNLRIPIKTGGRRSYIIEGFSVHDGKIAVNAIRGQFILNSEGEQLRTFPFDAGGAGLLYRVCQLADGRVFGGTRSGYALVETKDARKQRPAFQKLKLSDVVLSNEVFIKGLFRYGNGKGYVVSSKHGAKNSSEVLLFDQMLVKNPKRFEVAEPIGNCAYDSPNDKTGVVWLPTQEGIKGYNLSGEEVGEVEGSQENIKFISAVHGKMIAVQEQEDWRKPLEVRVFEKVNADA